MISDIHGTPFNRKSTIDCYKTKIKYIIQTDVYQVNLIQNELDKVAFFLNHFVMSDYDNRQMNNFIKHEGISQFLSLIDSLEREAISL